MDPTQDQAETKRLMAAIKATLDRITDEFRRDRPRSAPDRVSPES